MRGANTYWLAGERIQAKEMKKKKNISSSKKIYALHRFTNKAQTP